MDEGDAVMMAALFLIGYCIASFVGAVIVGKLLAFMDKNN